MKGSDLMKDKRHRKALAFITSLAAVHLCSDKRWNYIHRVR